MKKGFIPVILIAVLALVIAVGGVGIGLAWRTNRLDRWLPPNIKEMFGRGDHTKDWEIYRGELLGFGMKYPKDWEVSGRGGEISFSKTFTKDSAELSCNFDVQYMGQEGFLDIWGEDYEEWFTTVAAWAYDQSTQTVAGVSATKFTELDRPDHAKYFLKSEEGDRFFLLVHWVAEEEPYVEDELKSAVISECRDAFNRMLSTFEFVGEKPEEEPAEEPEEKPEEEPEEEPEPEPGPILPVISEVKISVVAETFFTVTWKTDVPATSRVDYGKTTSYGAYRLDNRLVTEHFLTPNLGLVECTTYHYRVLSKDAEGNEEASSDATFVTNCHECADSDGGKNYYVKGTTEGVNRGGTDFCGIRTVPEYSEPTKVNSCEKMAWGSGKKCTLYEWFCGMGGEFPDSHAVTIEYECPHGCEDGACVKGP